MYNEIRKEYNIFAVIVNCTVFVYFSFISNYIFTIQIRTCFNRN